MVTFAGGTPSHLCSTQRLEPGSSLLELPRVAYNRHGTQLEHAAQLNNDGPNGTVRSVEDHAITGLQLRTKDGVLGECAQW